MLSTVNLEYRITASTQIQLVREIVHTVEQRRALLVYPMLAEECLRIGWLSDILCPWYLAATVGRPPAQLHHIHRLLKELEASIALRIPNGMVKHARQKVIASPMRMI